MTTEAFFDDLHKNGHVVGTQEIGLIVKFTPTEIRDLIDAATERGFEQLGDMARQILLDNIVS